MKGKKALQKKNSWRWETPGMGHFIEAKNRNVGGTEWEEKGICDTAAAEVYLSHWQEKQWSWQVT